jgi:hypothetical protein
MDPMKTTYDFVNWIGRFLFRDFVIALINFWAPWGEKDLLTAREGRITLGFVLHLQLPTFRRNIMPSSSGLNMKAVFSHDVTAQQTDIDT